jgi:Zn-dependent metalloprotease
MLALVAAPVLFAGIPMDKDAELKPVARAAQQHVQARAFQLGLDADHAFAMKGMTEEGAEAHVRLHQSYKGVPVFEGEVIVHSRNGEVEGLTDDLVRGLKLNTTPSIEANEALATAHADLAPTGAYATEPTARLVVARVDVPVRVGRNGDEITVQRAVLAYHVHAELENGAEETSHMDYLVNAHTGAILERWSTLHTTAAVGSGRSQYSGTVSLNTNTNGSGYDLHDTTRGGGIKTYNLNHATSGLGTLYNDADNTWGDSANYVEGSDTAAANGQTAGVDAHYGIQNTWDMYQNVFGRNGIDGNGTATYSRVHYSNSYDNAFWSDSCFCMTYGDGSSFKTLTSMDVAGHEMTHGVTSKEANLTYRGESGGLNESMSDIFGTMAEFYQGSTGNTIPNSRAGADFKIGEDLNANPLRHMDKPSLDGRSPNAWSSSLKRIDVHYSSGPMNRCFYFLSQGASANTNAINYSSYLPAGMAGLENDTAAKIVYRALRDYMTSSSTYAGAKTACLNAAVSLGYPVGSATHTAVINAFKAINVQ